jgi:uncharacterized protein (DUF849 family)
VSAVQACLNGGRTRDEHPAVPLSLSELVADAGAVRAAGAFSAHLHPRDGTGAQTLDPRVCDAVVAALRRAVPALRIGLSTAEAIQRDPFLRARSMASWRSPPDFVSVNIGEPGWAGLVRAALHAGIDVEAGLATPADAQELADSAFAHRVLRVLVEVDGGTDDARAVAALAPQTIPQLWHGYGPSTWEVLVAGAAAGHDVRVGLEDALELPDGRVAADNAELVAAAVELVASARLAAEDR